jgi:hypothetical protein
MRIKRMNKFTILVFVLISLTGCSSIFSAPEPPYQSILKEAPFEVRDYKPMIVAEVSVEGERYQAINDGFRLLADYIFGNNISQKQIPMTAPVVQSSSLQKDLSRSLPMTAPVLQGAKVENKWVVQFVMPEGETLNTLPTPNNNLVALKEMPAQRFAVIRFSGRNTDKLLHEKTKSLEDWIQTKNYGVLPKDSDMLPDIFYAFYNPPFVPSFFRRNEILIPLRTN